MRNANIERFSFGELVLFIRSIRDMNFKSALNPRALSWIRSSRLSVLREISLWRFWGAILGEQSRFGYEKREKILLMGVDRHAPNKYFKNVHKPDPRVSRRYNVADKTTSFGFFIFIV
jgi:hypothetical protein